MSEFSSSEISRYSRQLILPEVGAEGQLRLKSAKVLVVGAGGLGSAVCLYLAAAGVGRIGIVEFDIVDMSNLQRQILYGSSDVGKPKLEAAAKRLWELNPEIVVDLLNLRLTAENVVETLRPYDIVIDGTDNFGTRYLINDACVILKKPNVYGAIYRFEGQASVFHPPTGPCYRCLFPEPPPAESVPNCAEGGVLGVLAGMVGVVQATEAIKLIIGIGDSLVGRLFLYDAAAMRLDTFKIKRNVDCRVCGDNPSITTVEDLPTDCRLPTAADVDESNATTDTTTDTTIDTTTEITAQALHARRKSGESPRLLDVRNPEEYALCHLDGATIIPLNDLQARACELDRHTEIVVYCKSGARSMRAIEILRAAGFEKLSILKGGILAWAESVDKSMPRY